MSSDAAVPELERARHAWRSGLKSDLLAPLNYLIQQSQTLVHEAEEANAEFVADIRRLVAAGEDLFRRVNAILDATPGDTEHVDLSKVRHQLRTPLGQIIGYCELWLVDEKDQLAELLLDRFVPDLQETHDLARQMFARLDDIVNFRNQPADAARDAGGADWLEMYRRIVLGSHRESLSEKGTLLVVDDSEMNRDLLARWLKREGHDVTLADNGRRALELIRQQPFDLVLLDILMPEMDGVQVLQHLKADEKTQHIPVIMISALGETESVVRCIEIGADDYLPKPFNRAVLKARIGASLEKKRLVEQIQKERKRADELLHVILPAPIVRKLKATDAVLPRRFENVAVLFCDIVGFTTFCDQNQPENVVPHLQRLIEDWEEVALRHGVEKIKTIGDAFMAAAGLLQETPQPPVLHCVRCGLDMIAAVQKLPVPWNIRIGIHVGPVVAGVIGKRQYLFDLWGDTVNTAARMESHGVPGCIVLSRPAWQQVAPHCRGQSLGEVAVKGKKPMEMVRFDGFLS